MRCEFEHYLERIRELFGPASLSILLLKTVAVLYPALVHSGVSLEAPLLVIVQNEYQLRSLLAVLQGYGRQVMKSLAAPPKEIRKALTEATYNLVFFRYAPGRYLLENLEQLTERASELDLSTPSNSLLIIVVAVGGIPTRYFGHMAGVLYIQDTGSVEAPIESLPEIERSFILHWLRNRNKHWVSQSGEPLDVFRTAAIFLIDFLKDSGCGEEEMKGYEMALIEELEKLEDVWDAIGEPDDYANAFRTALFGAVDWLPRPVFDRSRVEGLAFGDLKSAIYVDCDYYYLPPALFEALCEPLTGNTDMTHVKIMLTEAGLLKPEKGSKGRNYFTPKVEIRTAMGYEKRIRMMRLAREKVDLLGEISFLEIMEIKGDGDDV